MNDPDLYIEQLIDRMIEGTISREEFSELESKLLQNPGLRKKFRARMRMESALHGAFHSAHKDIPSEMLGFSPKRSLRFGKVFAVVGMAAALIVGIFIAVLKVNSANPEFVAKIVSEEAAAWSTHGQIGEGAELVPGTLHLERGIASLRFNSGVTADLEAPVTIELFDPMRCRMSRGKAVFDVPESAIGFIVETPNGYAVDYGTRFAVALQQGREDAEFGVLSGRISVHHTETEQEADVRTGDMVFLSATGIDKTLSHEAQSTHPEDSSTKVLRFRTNGREASIVHGDMRERFLDPEMLMVKRDMPINEENIDKREWWPKDRRSLISFDVANLEKEKLQKVILRLNLVPSGRGYANLLPERTRIQVYGIKDQLELESWESEGLAWADAPGSMGEEVAIDLSEVTLLGSFEISRSQFEGPITFESDELNRFVEQDKTGVVGLLIATDSMPQDSWAMVHAFASSQHLEAAGPMLEVRVKGPGMSTEAYVVKK